MRIAAYFIITLILLGCSGSVGDKDGFIMTSGEVKDSIETLSLDNIDLKENLTKKNWTKISANLDKFYSFSTYSQKKDYSIKMTFENGNILAYADCKKLTARYIVNDKKISFYEVSYAPAIELATCQESEDADKVVYQFLLRDFEVIEIKDRQIIFKSHEIDTEVILSK